MSVASAISDALSAGHALCKFITRNDVGATGAHQCGFHLPKSAWSLFTPHAPIKGRNDKSKVCIRWSHDLTTDSVVSWYGVGTRSEYRLTCFGPAFPWMHERYVGSMLVLVPFSLTFFTAHVLETDADIEFLKTALGIETLGSWSIFTRAPSRREDESGCLDRVIETTVTPLNDFPDGKWMAASARDAVKHCSKSAAPTSADDKLLKWVAAEYKLFQKLETKLALPSIRRPFTDIDAFMDIAASVMNRRKSRAGHSFENHVEELLRTDGVRFDRQPRIDGNVKPDLLIPGKAAYEDPAFPVSRLVVAGLKTTCKDRWRQILNESRRIPEKHLVTLQECISSNQLLEMREANVTLVVPKPFHKGYDLRTGIRLLSVDDFLAKLHRLQEPGAS
jgi:hypothetical protein